MARLYRLEPLNGKEVLALKKACFDFEEDFIITIFLETGISITDLVNLKKSNICWMKHSYIKINNKKIPINNNVKEYLKEFFKDKTKFKYKERWVQKLVHRIGKKVRINKRVTPQVLRHTFAVGYLNEGGDPKKLKEILGHAHQQTTNQYKTYYNKSIDNDFRRIWK